MPTAKQSAAADRLLAAMDWSRFDSMTDEEIRAAWAWDKDTTWPTDGDLEAFTPVEGGGRSAKDAAE